MSNPFDAYHKWLGIPPNEQPADHYRLLGITRFESDADVIANAADKQMAHVRSFQAGEHFAESQRLLNEISAARLCLLSAKDKATYDEKLRNNSATRTESAGPVVQVETGGDNAPGSSYRLAQRRSSKLPLILGVGGVAVAVVVALIVWGGRTPDGRTENSPGPAETATIGPGDQALDNPPPPPPPSVAAPDKTAGGGSSQDAPTENVAVPLGRNETPSAPAPSELPTEPAPPAEKPVVEPPEPPVVADKPAVEPGATPEAKLPVPSSADQATVIKQLDDVYGLDKRRSNEQSVKLARELHALGLKTQDNPAERFTLFRKAAELAGHGGDAELMLQAIGAIAADFDIDVLTVKGKMLKGFADRAGKTPEIKSLVDASRQYTNQAIAQGRYDLALGMAKLAYRACQRPEGREFRKETFDRQRQIQQLYDEHQKLQDALLAIEADPNDGEANLFLGRLYCFEQGDWQGGLPHLAKGSDAALALIAEQDLAKPAEPADQMKVADAWWDLAQTHESDKIALTLRAAYWYRQAQRKVTSTLDLAKIEKRLGFSAQLSPALQVAATHLTERRFLALPTVAKMFARTSPSWKVAGNSLEGAVGVSPGRQILLFLSRTPVKTSVVRFGFKMKSKWYHIIHIGIDDHVYYYSRGHWRNEGVLIHWAGETIRIRPGPKVESAERWNSLDAILSHGTLEFYYDGERQWQGKVAGDPAALHTVQVGFGSYRANVAIKDFYLETRREVHPNKANSAARFVPRFPDPPQTWSMYVGQWAVGESPERIGAVFTLNADFTAKKSNVPDAAGKWEYVKGTARIVWSDGWRDIIQPEGIGFRKSAFRPGTTFDDQPTSTERAFRR